LSDLAYLTITEAAGRIAAKALSPVELTDAVLARIDELDDTLKSYITVTPDEARDAARHAESEIANGNYRGPLHGIPIGLKDL
jgi:aspartyl-tRNA(Asn)/glutamyl-tRNA(Gln) amidotransferase subunit A